MRAYAILVVLLHIPPQLLTAMVPFPVINQRTGPLARAIAFFMYTLADCCTVFSPFAVSSDEEEDELFSDVDIRASDSDSGGDNDHVSWWDKGVGGGWGGGLVCPPIHNPFCSQRLDPALELNRRSKKIR